MLHFQCMKFKKKFILWTAFLLLMGMFNCVALEPAFAYHEDETACQAGEDGHCCFVCHSIHHLWTAAGDGHSLSSLTQQENFLKDRYAMALEPPQRLIFHPPAVS